MRNEHLTSLVFEYETMSQEGSVGFFEKAAFDQLLDYYEGEYLFEKALEVVDHALEQHGYSQDLFIRKGKILIETKNWDSALVCLEKAEMLSPQDFEVSLTKIEVYLKMRNFSKARALLGLAKQRAVSKMELSEIHFLEALFYEGKERFNHMFHSLRRAALLNPHEETILERLWFCVEMTQKYEESIRLHKKLLDIAPFSHMAWYNLGYAFSCLEEFEKAIDAFEYAILINEKFEFAYRASIDACLELGLWVKALALSKELLEFSTPDADLLTQIGLCYENLDENVKAMASYKKAADLSPQSDLVHFQMGNCLFRIGQWPQAIRCYEKAVSLNNRNEEVFAALGEAYYCTAEYQKAYDSFFQAAEIAPEQSQYWMQLASFLLELENFEEALEVLDEAEINASSPELIYCRIACLFLMGRRKEASVMLQTALSLSTDKSGLLFQLAPHLENDVVVMNLVNSYK